MEATGSDLHRACLTRLCCASRLSQPLDASFLPRPFQPCFMLVAPMGFTLQRFGPPAKPTWPSGLPSPPGVVRWTRPPDGSCSTFTGCPDRAAQVTHESRRIPSRTGALFAWGRLWCDRVPFCRRFRGRASARRARNDVPGKRPREGRPRLDCDWVPESPLLEFRLPRCNPGVELPSLEASAPGPGNPPAPKSGVRSGSVRRPPRARPVTPRATPRACWGHSDDPPCRLGRLWLRRDLRCRDLASGFHRAAPPSRCRDAWAARPGRSPVSAPRASLQPPAAAWAISGARSHRSWCSPSAIRRWLSAVHRFWRVGLAFRVLSHARVRASIHKVLP
jgi:hypothetical protein